MESASSTKPRKMTDSFDIKCKFCGNVAYSESIVGVLQDDSITYKYTKLVTGSFTQDCDAEGNVSGPVIPYCKCRENK